jgi:hypothetical protein
VDLACSDKDGKGNAILIDLLIRETIKAAILDQMTLRFLSAYYKKHGLVFVGGL